MRPTARREGTITSYHATSNPYTRIAAVIDAAVRQLRHEGWMHNRARLLTAGFPTKTLYVD